jgi:hypothetical protein
MSSNVPNIIHLPSCHLNYLENLPGEKPQGISCMDIGGGELVYSCVDCGAFATGKKKPSKPKIDSKLGLIAMMPLLAIYSYLCSLSVGWLCLSPIFISLLLIIYYRVSRGRNLFTDSAPDQIKTSILNAAGEGTPCTISFPEGRLLVSYPGSVIDIGFHNLTNLIYEDKTKGNHEMAGFGINYEDSEGSGQLQFFNQGMGSYKRAGKAVEEIRSKHAAWYNGCRVEPLSVFNLTDLKERQRQVIIHRT